MKLATINSILRWAGLALVVHVAHEADRTGAFVRLTLVFVGWVDQDSARARHHRPLSIGTMTAGNAGALIQDTQGGGPP